MRIFAPFRIVTITAFVVLVLLGRPQLTLSQTVARCGEGWLELIDGYPVLHLKGTPYEMGFQHGALLKEPIHQGYWFSSFHAFVR